LSVFFTPLKYKYVYFDKYQPNQCFILLVCFLHYLCKYSPSHEEESNMFIGKKLLIAALCSVFVTTAANATLIQFDTCVGANACKIAPNEAPIPNPITANPNAGILLGWNELQNVTLTENLYIDRVADPSASFVAQDSNGYYIIAGTIVSSHYIEWDPGAGSSNTVKATLNFDSDIFGFITSDDNLANSDAALGLTGYDYADFGLRGLESNDVTNFSPSGDNSLVDIKWKASSPGDWTRLITAFSPSAPPSEIPEPATLLLFGLGLLGLARLKK